MTLLRSLLLIAVLSASAPFTLAHEHAAKRAVLITGASSGLGLRMTEVLSENGFIVYAGARQAEDLKRLEAMPNVESIKLDVTVQADIDAAVALVESKERGLYGLVNNAGIAIFAPLIEVADSELDRIFDINVRGPVRVTQAFAPMIIKSKGRIATTGSIAGTLASSLFGPYSMSKHAVEAYTDALAAEMARFDVAVSVVEPGNYGSKIGASALKRFNAVDYWPQETLYPQEREGILARLPQVEKGPDPLAVAEAVLDIMTSDAPKRRYMVVDTVDQAKITVQKALQKVVQLNQDHAFSFSRAQLIEMLDEQLQITTSNK